MDGDRERRIIHNSHNQEYLVAFRRKDSGVITWTVYPSQEEFEKDRSEVEVHEEVIAQGISEAECVGLTRSTPMSAYRAEAFAMARGGGKTNFKVLAFQLEQLNLMQELGLIGKKEE